MIIKIEGNTTEDVAVARRHLEEMTRAWDHGVEEVETPTSTGSDARVDDKTLDPVAIAALVVSIPSAALAVYDLTDRIQKRRRAKELTDHAQQLAAQQVTMSLMSANRPVELARLTPDQLIDLLTTEPPPS